MSVVEIGSGNDHRGRTVTRPAPENLLKGNMRIPFVTNGTGHPHSRLEINGLNVVFNTPPSTKSIIQDGEECLQELPGYCPRNPFLVDEYPLCPKDWMRSNGRVKSYFLGVKEGDGLWLDFNGNNNLPTHLAVVISVQGVNAITGLPCEDPQLEQYIDKCPVHKREFQADRYCPDCEYRWPKQNYLASTGTPHGLFWIDGWRIGKTIRQFIITAEKMRGVATHILGDKRVFAIGLSFFLSKQERAKQNEYRPLMITHHSLDMLQPIGGVINNTDGKQWDSDGASRISFDEVQWHSLDSTGNVPPVVYNTSASNCCQSASNAIPETKGITRYAKDPCAEIQLCSVIQRRGAVSLTVPSTPVKMEVGAGSKIDQIIHPDPFGLDYWQDKPEGIIVVNYVSEVEAQRIIDGGQVKQSVAGDGFLKNIPVGQP